jgi:hypothetical protein
LLDGNVGNIVDREVAQKLFTNGGIACRTDIVLLVINCQAGDSQDDHQK